MTDEDGVADELLAVVHDGARPLDARAKAAGLWFGLVPTPPGGGLLRALVALILTGAPPTDWPRPRCLA